MSQIMMSPEQLRQMFAPGQSIGTQASPEEMRQRMFAAQRGGLPGMTPPPQQMQRLALGAQPQTQAFRQGATPQPQALSGPGVGGGPMVLEQQVMAQGRQAPQISIAQQPQGGGIASAGRLGSAENPFQYSRQAPPVPPQPILQQGAMPGRAMPPMAQGRPMGQPMGGMRPAAKPVAPPMQARPMGGARPMVKSAPPPQPARPMGGARPAVKAPAPAPMGRGPAAPRRYK